MQHHKPQIKVLLTAGHAATTALATIEELQSDSSNSWEISWIGPRSALEGTKVAPFELDLFPKLGVKVYSIAAGKLQTKFTRNTIPALLKVPRGFFASLRLLLRIKPDVVLSFGGFAALPVVMSAWILRIPIVLHEQTVAAGLANKVSGYLATKIALARTESHEFFQKQKCVVVGNPLMKEVVQTKTKDSLPALPLLYVTGGSRGAQRINTPIFELLPELLKSYSVIHQTGELDIKKAREIRSRLKTTLRKRYLPYSFVTPLSIGSIYEKASIVIGRAGANTVSEVMSLAIPSIFIPIPWSRADEQTKNALLAQKVGISVLLKESQLSKESLLGTIALVHKNWDQMRASASEHEISETDKKAASKLVSVLLQVLA